MEDGRHGEAGARKGRGRKEKQGNAVREGWIEGRAAGGLGGVCTSRANSQSGAPRWTRFPHYPGLDTPRAWLLTRR